MKGLTNQEKKILHTFEIAFQYLTEEEKRNLYYFGLGIVFNSGHKKKIEQDSVGGK